MIVGEVSDDGVPIVILKFIGREWSAIIDTGFNGDLELPSELRGKLNDQPVGRVKSKLASGQVVEEDAIATFSPDSQLLIGTNLLGDYFLEIKFASKSVRLERE